MVDHWKYNGPPVYIAVAAYLGMRKRRPKRRSMRSVEAMQELKALFGGVTTGR